MTQLDAEHRPFASSLSARLASKNFAWSIAVKSAVPLREFRLISLPGPCIRGSTELQNPRVIFLWLGATHGLRSGAFGKNATPGVDEARMLLDADEARRLERFLHVEDRMSYLVAHAGARLLLGALAGRAADRVQFETSPLGKPRLVDAPTGLDFSLSHARGAVAAAAAYMPIGVDIEPLREISDLDEMVEITLSSEERRTLARTPEALRSRLFLRYWTLKEAILKAAGVGFAVSPHTLTVDAGPSPAVLAVPDALGPAEQWHVIAAS
ncbi:4'-phosphopantetheinyl transferase [Bradyrhizobium sp. USDA 377]